MFKLVWIELQLIITQTRGNNDYLSRFSIKQTSNSIKSKKLFELIFCTSIAEAFDYLLTFKLRKFSDLLLTLVPTHHWCLLIIKYCIILLSAFCSIMKTERRYLVHPLPWSYRIEMHAFFFESKPTLCLLFFHLKELFTLTLSITCLPLQSFQFIKKLLW